jgi:hypothetical protein
MARAGFICPAVPPPASKTLIYIPPNTYCFSMFAVLETESTSPICASSIISELPP